MLLHTGQDGIRPILRSVLCLYNMSISLKYSQIALVGFSCYCSRNNSFFDQSFGKKKHNFDVSHVKTIFGPISIN